MPRRRPFFCRHENQTNNNLIASTITVPSFPAPRSGAESVVPFHESGEKGWRKFYHYHEEVLL
jgi:hypothetical protein